MTSNSHALQLIDFWHSSPPLAPHIVARAKQCLLDALGCALFGVGQPWGRIMTAEILADGCEGPCSVLGSVRTAPAPQAALCNGTAIHGFELDDLLPASIIHPGTVIVPAVLATAEASNASGMTLLRGIVTGYECMSRLSLAMGLEPSHRGFHKTSVVGPVAAAIASGVVMGLSPDALVCAAGLACSAASGIKSYAGGSGGGMVKRMHAGHAAEAGVRMSRLAQRGFTGPRAAIDGRYGLLEVFGGEGVQPRRLTDGLGATWAMDDLWVKVYPICGWIQGVAQLLSALRGPAPIALDGIEKVTVGTAAFAVKNNANPAPSDTMEAQYSIPYCCAVALDGDPADPNEFCAPAISDPARRAFASRVELRIDEESEAVYPARFGSRVRLHLRCGDMREAATLDPHGTAADPCTAEELVTKFSRLAALSNSRLDACAIADAVAHLDTADSLHELQRLLRH
ncbi:MAG: MmgE/PrpD family protein [Burkholderiales bacterium]|nr:MmgE/PrpD family protein [Burkholderiales bacterium]